MAGCSLNKSAKHNWVEDAGGLPEYICEVARAVGKGTDLDHAIPIAISQIKKWAAGVTHNGKDGTPKAAGAKTQAKAKAALAQWEALKAKAHAKSGAKKVSEAVKACEALEDAVELSADKAEWLYLTFNGLTEAEMELEAYERSLAHVGPFTRHVLALTNATEWSMDAVRSAYSRIQATKRKNKRSQLGDGYYDSPDYRTVREVYNTYILVATGYGDDSGTKFFQVPYTVDTLGNITFGDEAEVKQTYTPVGSATATLSNMPSLEKVLALSRVTE